MSRSLLTRSGVAGAAAVALAFAAAVPAQAQDTPVGEPSEFTSSFTVMATPDMVLNAETGEPEPGTPGASGTFDFRLNSDEEVICFDITVEGINPPFESPARTATHIHEEVDGQTGPPRLAFPNPSDNGDGTFTSNGCMQGPFETGLTPDGGPDTGEGFSLAEIEADPGAYYADTHTSENPEGAVRGQLSAMPVDGVDTGAGGTAAGSSSDGLPVAPIGLGALALAGLAGAFAWRRATAETH